MTRKSHIFGILLALGGALLLASCDYGDPGHGDETPLYRWEQDDEPSSGERGSLIITEINYAGSVTDDGTRDKDDVYIELQNKHPRPINPSRWRLHVMGDVERNYRLPDIEEPLEPNEYFVLARRDDGAFADVVEEQGAVIDDLELGTREIEIELRDADRRLMESVGSVDEEVFAGGYDTATVRSMERAELIFGNDGDQSRNWHAFSNQEGTDTINEGYRENTLASPGMANSADYSGSSTSGNFE
ncbi:MAG: hypothetical protein ACOCV2_04280 [Persicimonas sp.]